MKDIDASDVRRATALPAADSHEARPLARAGRPTGDALNASKPKGQLCTTGRLNHLIFCRHDCAEVSANPAPHMQATNQTSPAPSGPWNAGITAVTIRTRQADMPLAA